MPGTPKANRSQIEAALATWEGDITQAAAQLGMSRRALYYRMEALGIDHGRYKSDASHQSVKGENFTHRADTTASNQRRVRRMGSIAAAASPKVSGVKYSEAPRGGKVAPVTVMTSTESDPTAEEAMTGRLPRKPSTRPDHLRRIQRLKWVVSAHLQRDLSETDINTMLLDEILPVFEARYGLTSPEASKPGMPSSAEAASAPSEEPRARGRKDRR